MRSTPWRATIGSVTPSSFTRLRSVVMFCWIAKSCRCLICVGRQRDRDRAALAERVRVDATGSGPACAAAPRRARASSPLRSAIRDARRRHRCHAGERDALVAQQRAVVALHAREQLLHGALHVDFVQEVDAAAQVEAEAHRLQAQRAHPARRARHVATAPPGIRARLPRCIASRALSCVLDVVEAQDQPVALEVRALDRHALATAAARRPAGAGVGDGGAVIARELQRGRLAEHVRQGEQQAARAGR